MVPVGQKRPIGDFFNFYLSKVLPCVASKAGNVGSLRQLDHNSHPNAIAAFVLRRLVRGWPMSLWVRGCVWVA